MAWHKLAETCITTLKIGSSVLIDGELQSRSWKNEDGSSRSVVEIRARRIQFLEPSMTHDVEELGAENAGPKTNTFQQIEPTEFDFGYQNLKI